MGYLLEYGQSTGATGLVAWYDSLGTRKYLEKDITFSTGAGPGTNVATTDGYAYLVPMTMLPGVRPGAGAVQVHLSDRLDGQPDAHGREPGDPVYQPGRLHRHGAGHRRGEIPAFPDGQHWYYRDATHWTAATDTSAQANRATAVNRYLGNFATQ